MKYAFWTVLFMGCLHLVCVGQADIAAKAMSAHDSRVLTMEDLGRWPSLGVCVLSSDGKYTAYVVNNEPAGGQTLVIQSVTGSWKVKRVVKGLAPLYYFTLDSRSLYWKEGDSLWLQQVGEEQPELIGTAVGDPVYPWVVRGGWLGWKEKEAKGMVVLRDLTGKHTYRLAGVQEYSFATDGNSVMISSQDSSKATMEWLDLTGGNRRMIWQSAIGETATRIKYDNRDSQVVFDVKNKQGGILVWYCRKGMAVAERKAGSGINNMSEDFVLAGNDGFSGNGRYLVFSLQRKEDEILDKSVSPAVPIDIWSYRDMYLNPEQAEREKHVYTGVMKIEGGPVLCLDPGAEERLEESLSAIYGDRAVVLDQGLSGPSSDRSGWWIVSLNDGKRRLLKQPTGNGVMQRLENFSFSPEGRWLVYWDREKGHYFSHDLQADRSINLTAAIPARFDQDFSSGTYKQSVSDQSQARVSGWYEKESSVLLYDRYDMWKVDLSGNRAAVNMTRGYGKAQQTRLRLVYDIDNAGRPKVYHGDEELILTGFNSVNKYNGFFRMKLDRPAEPELLTMGPYTYYKVSSQLPHDYMLCDPMHPLEAGMGNDHAWVVKRESATETPNYYYTRDLRQYTALTDLAPHKGFKWLYTELVNYPMIDGRMSQGVLYKPSDFDRNKKYPVIFNYYQQLSSRMYEYPYPHLMSDNIDIAWFVTHDYLVFTPDIHYDQDASAPGGRPPGECAYNAVVGAAQHLSKFPYVNSRRLAVQGQSFGGLQTSYLATHSSLFVAACEMAGTTDAISAYLTLVGSKGIDQHDKQRIAEIDGRIGSTPWERPDLYRRNSSVLSADKTKAAVLIVHNKKDHAVQWRQGVELYMALRRLGKPCWMLQYDNSGHAFANLKDAFDYTMRVTQFFDHYLKGSPAPKWMTGTSLAKHKQTDNLLALDPGGSCGKICTVCSKHPVGKPAMARNK